MRSSLKTRCVAADTKGIAEAAIVLQAGGVVAFPTETVYGLGADATSPDAVSAIYEAKGRPSFNPLIAHVASLAEAFDHGIFSPVALRLAEQFWPGPLTLVVPFRDASPAGGTICDLARAGLASVGLRVPGSQIARALVSACGRPLAAPSANRSGHVSPVTAAHVLEDLNGRIDMVLDGGACEIGVESTIIACLDEDWQMLRAGGVALEDVLRVAGRASSPRPDLDKPIAPGQLASHYAPRAALRLNARVLQPGEAGLDFGGVLAATAAPGAMILELSEHGDLHQAAARLFSHLRALDLCAEAIAVAPIPDHDIGAAINDRLVRAATRR